MKRSLLKLPASVFNFHRIPNRRSFERILRSMTKLWRPVSLEEVKRMYQSSDFDAAVFHVTFDDGDLTFYRNALPVLIKLQVPVSVFVSPRTLSDGRNFWFQEIEGYDEWELRKSVSTVLRSTSPPPSHLTVHAILKSLPIAQIWEIIKYYRLRTGTARKPRLNMCTHQLKDAMQHASVEVGAHTLNHPILANETAWASRSEVVDSILELEDLLKAPVRYFAYPNGVFSVDFGTRELRYLDDAGVELAFAVSERPLSRADHRLIVPRFDAPAAHLSKPAVTKYAAKYLSSCYCPNAKALFAQSREIANRLKARQWLSGL